MIGENDEDQREHQRDEQRDQAITNNFIRLDDRAKIQFIKDRYEVLGRLLESYFYLIDPGLDHRRPGAYYFRERAKINYPFFFVNESFVVHPWRRRKAFKNFIVILKSQKYFYEKFKQKNTFQFRIKRIKIFVGSLLSNFKELAQFKFKGWECYIEKMIFNFIMIFI